jgi:hypothetical protein
VEGIGLTRALLCALHGGVLSSIGVGPTYGCNPRLDALQLRLKFWSDLPLWHYERVDSIVDEKAVEHCG